MKAIRFALGESTSTTCGIEMWVGPREGLEVVAKTRTFSHAGN